MKCFYNGCKFNINTFFTAEFLSSGYIKNLNTPQRKDGSRSFMLDCSIPALHQNRNRPAMEQIRTLAAWKQFLSSSVWH
jgi:hypothetical protein